MDESRYNPERGVLTESRAFSWEVLITMRDGTGLSTSVRLRRCARNPRMTCRTVTYDCVQWLQGEDAVRSGRLGRQKRPRART
jgi:hypothetical protein